MTRQESERKLNELRKKYIALISSMNFAKAQKIKNKIDSLEREVDRIPWENFFRTIPRSSR